MTPAEFREQFQGLDSLVHLASCSQGALSHRTIAALDEYKQTIIDHGAAWNAWMVRVQRARELFAASIGADVDQVAVVPSASEGAYQVASTQAWQERPVVVTTDMEFPSVAHVWLAQQPRGAKVQHVADRDWEVEVEDYAALIGPETGLVSVPLVSYRNGLRLPVREIAKVAHDAGARVFVDAYQAYGVDPVDVSDLDCDYLVTGCLKYALGLPGLAFLYVRPGLVDEVPPSMTGWFGRIDPFGFDPRSIDFPTHARRFESGTPSVPSAYGAVAGLELLAELDPRDVQRHVAELTGHLRSELVAMGEIVRSPQSDARRGPQIALWDADPNRLDAFLRERRIAGSPRGDVLRVSFHHYNTESDIEALLRAVREYRAS